MIDLTLRVKGDTCVDDHHTVEDTGIVMGQALREALGDKRGIRRFGSVMVPLDEALVMAAVDISGRGELFWDVAIGPSKVGSFDTELGHEFFAGLAETPASRCTCAWSAARTPTTSWRPPSRPSPAPCARPWSPTSAPLAPSPPLRGASRERAYRRG